MESIGGIKYTYIVGEPAARRKPGRSRGQSCDSFDVIDKEATIAEPEVGNRILIPSAGAYTISYASEFNGFSIPENDIDLAGGLI